MADAGTTLNASYSRALANEILASERYRASVLVVSLAVFLAIETIFLLTAGDLLRHYATKPISIWTSFFVVVPFLFYECVVILILTRVRAMGMEFPKIGRFGNAIVETSLPTVILWVAADHTTPQAAFGTWPSMLYFVFIVASTLRLNFVLPVFTGIVAAMEYLIVASIWLPFSSTADDIIFTPLYHVTKAFVMAATGIVAGLVAMRLRQNFERAMAESVARERVTSLFGQHVSPAVVDRLLNEKAESAGELREICVMFLDIRDFTAFARDHAPEEVVAFLNEAFAFMIETVDGHHGFINKFLGDGFLAVFGAPIEDAQSVRHAVDCARAILAEIDRRAQPAGAPPLQVRIGLHYGRAVTGSIGSPRRKEFTVIGDTVNLAARLEQLNKEHGSRLLVSDTVVNALGPDTGPAKPLGEVAVKGYDRAIRVWRLD